MKENKKLIKKKIIMKGEKVSSEILYNRDGFMISEKIYDDNGEIIRYCKFFNNEKIEFSKIGDMEYIKIHRKSTERYLIPPLCFSKSNNSNCFTIKSETYFKENGEIVVNDYSSDTVFNWKYNKTIGKYKKVTVTNMTTKDIIYSLERFIDNENRISSTVMCKGNMEGILKEMTYFDDGKIEVNEYEYNCLMQEKGEKISTTIFDQYWNKLNCYNVDGSYSIYHYDYSKGKNSEPIMEEYNDKIVIRKSFNYGKNVKVSSLFITTKNKYEIVSNIIEIDYKEKDIINKVYIDMVHNHIKHLYEHDITEIIEYYD